MKTPEVEDQVNIPKRKNCTKIGRLIQSLHDKERAIFEETQNRDEIKEIDTKKTKMIGDEIPNSEEIRGQRGKAKREII